MGTLAQLGMKFEIILDGKIDYKKIVGNLSFQRRQIKWLTHPFLSSKMKTSCHGKLIPTLVLTNEWKQKHIEPGNKMVTLMTKVGMERTSCLPT